jgi:probable F420-dependent oxidoreductase
MDLTLGRVGIWTFDFDRQPMALVREEVAELEALGYGTIWIPELAGREALTHAAVLLAATKRMVVANGIARIGERTPRAMVAAQQTLAEAYPGRHLLGLGLGGMKKEGISPLEAMRSYLDAMDEVSLVTPKPALQPVRILAAYGPTMLKLAVERSAGAHTYKVTAEHTAYARQLIGPQALLAVEYPVVFETDPQKARRIARAHLETYLRLPAHLAKFRRLGFTEDDFAAGGSDRLVDALVAWGTIEDILPKLKAHFEAGADHVCIQVLGIEPGTSALPQWRILAEALLH